MSSALEAEQNRDAARSAEIDASPSVLGGAAISSESRPARGAEDRQAAIVALGRRAIASSDASLLLQDAAALLAETLNAQLSGVAEILPDGSAYVLRLASMDQHAQPATMQEFSLDGQQSLAAYTLSVAHPMVIDDLTTENRFSDLFLRKHGARSAICCPLQLLDHSFGALAVCSTSPKHFCDSDAVFVEAVAHLVTTTIGRDRLVKELDQERRLARSVLETVESLVLTLSPEGKVLHTNPACDRLTGFTADEIRNRPIWNSFLLASDVPIMLAAFEKIRHGQTPDPFETNISTKHGAQRRISWSLSVLENHRGRPEGVIASGLDLTGRAAVEEQLKAALEAVDELRRELTQVGPAAAGEAFKAMPKGDGSERRRKPRRSYPYIQLVAPIQNGQLPPRSSFREVKCRDISAGGFSFTSNWLPKEKMIVAAFGSGKSLIYLVAEVVHTCKVERDGKPAYLLGCRYTGRATY